MNEQQKSKILTLWLPICFAIGLVISLIVCGIVTVQARELSPSIFDADFLLSSEVDDYAIYGYDGYLYIRNDFYTRDLDGDAVLYNFWYGDTVETPSIFGGFYRFDFRVLKGDLTNINDSTTRIRLDQDNTVQTLPIKSIDIDENYVAVYFKDHNGNYLVYVSYVPSSGTTAQPDYAFDSYTIDTDHHFIEYDATWREFYIWNSSTNLWERHYYTNTDVYVDTLLSAPYSIGLTAGASVSVACSHFSGDDVTPTPTDSPDTPSPAATHQYVTIDCSYDYVYVVDLYGTNLGVGTFVTETNPYYSAAISSNSGLSNPFCHYVFINGRPSSYTSDWQRFALYFTADDLVTQSNDSNDWSGVYQVPRTEYDASWSIDYICSTYTRYGFGVGDLKAAGVFDDTTSGYIYCVYGIDIRGASAPSIGNTDVSDIRTLSSWPVSDFYTDWTGEEYSYLSDIIYSPLYQAMLLGLSNSSEDTPEPDTDLTVTPEPTSTPTPTPTPMGSIIVIWPSSTPTPTPFLELPISTPPAGDLSPDTTEHVLSLGGGYISDWTSGGLLTAAFAFVPSELQFLIWFLIFILIILAVIKLILHFIM